MPWLFWRFFPLCCSCWFAMTVTVTVTPTVKLGVAFAQYGEATTILLTSFLPPIKLIRRFQQGGLLYFMYSIMYEWKGEKTVKLYGTVVPKFGVGSTSYCTFYMHWKTSMKTCVFCGLTYFGALSIYTFALHCTMLVAGNISLFFCETAAWIVVNQCSVVVS